MNTAPGRHSYRIPYLWFTLIVILFVVSACGGGAANAPTAVSEQPTTSSIEATPTAEALPTQTEPATSTPMPTVIPVSLPEPVKGVKFGALRYTPDGKSLAFVGSVYDASTGYSDSTLYVKPADGIEARAVAQTSRRLIFDIAFSPDGASIAYSVQESGVFVAAVEGESTPTQVKGANCLSWSPDGKGLLALTKGTVSLVPIDGSPAQTLFTESTSIGCAWYSPDGKSIAFLGQKDTKGFPKLLVSDLNGKTPRHVSGENNRGLFDINWSPDGSRLAYFVTDVEINGETVCVAEVTSATAKCLKVTGKRYLDFSWSPDSKNIALLSLSTSAQQLRSVEVMSVENMTSTSVTKPNADPMIAQVGWTPTGERLLFSSVSRAPSKAGSIYAISPDGAQLRPLWGEDLVALQNQLVDFGYTVDSDNKLLFQRPKGWFFQTPKSILIFAPSQAALGSQRLPFEAQFGITGGAKNITTVYKAVLGDDLSPRVVLEAAMKRYPTSADAANISEKTLGNNAAAEIVFSIPNNEELILITANLNGYPVVVQFSYERGEGTHFLSMAEAIVASLRKE